MRRLETDELARWLGRFRVGKGPTWTSRRGLDGGPRGCGPKGRRFESCRAYLFFELAGVPETDPRLSVSPALPPSCHHFPDRPSGSLSGDGSAIAAVAGS